MNSRGRKCGARRIACSAGPVPELPAVIQVQPAGVSCRAVEIIRNVHAMPVEVGALHEICIDLIYINILVRASHAGSKRSIVSKTEHHMSCAVGRIYVI